MATKIEQITITRVLKRIADGEPVWYAWQWGGEVFLLEIEKYNAVQFAKMANEVYWLVEVQEDNQ